MNINLLTVVLRNFIAAFADGAVRIAGPANKLLALLIVIEVVLMGLWWALDGGERLSSIFKKLLGLCCWIWLVRSFPTLAKTFVDSLVQAGQLAAGGSSNSELLLDPSKIAGLGLDATEPIVRKMGDMHLSNISELFVFGIFYIAILGCFLVMALHVFMSVVEYYLIVALVGILLPFGVLQSTRFIAEKAIGAMIAVGVKLMVLSFLLAAVGPVLEHSVKFTGDETRVNELIAMFSTVCAMTLLVWKAPQMAAGLLSGSPSLSGSDVATPAMAAGGAAVGAATGGASFVASRAIVGAGSLALAGGKYAATKAAAAVKKGWKGTDSGGATADAAKQRPPAGVSDSTANS